ncbi:unnamed protein product, partial [Mesorhabditis belari]|uniref:HAT C-terminal dimerisation domain-containing protein n=1 Tax=Mesorhabditis belari TaxID=2138241 RepID=A0AAF3F0S3_9BILA
MTWNHWGHFNSSIWNTKNHTRFFNICHWTRIIMWLHPYNVIINMCEIFSSSAISVSAEHVFSFARIHLNNPKRQRMKNSTAIQL